MKTQLVIATFAAALISLGISPTIRAETPSLPNKLPVTPEIKKAFEGADTIEIQEITGTAGKFEVGGTYRVVGVCRQGTFKQALLYIGNTAEAGGAAIAPVEGSSLSKDCPTGTTKFDMTFTLLRPGLLHATIYDTNRVTKKDNTYAGVYLGDVVLKR